MFRYTNSFDYPEYSKDVRHQLLRHLNYRGHANYEIKKRRSNGQIQATVYYQLKGKTYRIGYFTIASPEKITSDLIRHNYDYLDALTSIRLTSAQNAVDKQLRAFRIMQDGGLL